MDVLKFFRSMFESFAKTVRKTNSQNTAKVFSSKFDPFYHKSRLGFAESLDRALAYSLLCNLLNL